MKIFSISKCQLKCALFIFHTFYINLLCIMQIAIHTVFILKENILFLEEWIKYHILLGFNKFYLYDNSKVNKVTGWDTRHSKTIVFGKINKYNINYDELVNMDDNQMNDHLKKLCDKYRCIEIIEWSPSDDKGNILYNQVDAHRHCLNIMKNNNIDWCANIDMDEYIVLGNFNNISDYITNLPSNVKNVKIGQIRFESRFYNLNKLVTEIKNAEINDLPRNHSNKNICNVNCTKDLGVHNIQLSSGRQITPPVKEICFNHYKLKYEKYKYIDNIDPNIKNKLDKNTFVSIIPTHLRSSSRP